MAAKTKRSKHKGLDVSDSTILVTFIVFLVLIVFFFGEFGEVSEVEPISSKVSQISTVSDQQLLLNQLFIDEEMDNGPAIIVGNVVSTLRLNNIAESDYDKLKDDLGVESEFVIYFEDAEGNLAEVMDTPCIGSGYATVNGHKCNE